MALVKILDNAKFFGKTILREVASASPTYAIGRSLSAVDEGSSVVFTLSTTNVANGTLVPYTISGISANDVTSGTLSGSFTVNSGLATATITMSADQLTEGAETATLTLNNAAASNFVLVNDTSTFDSDALAYVNAVQTADGASLENSVRLAINDFVVGCKSDGIWSAIKSSCILAGARTLNGALVPLMGTAPTNNNFVSADYNRKTGLVGNGSTKRLISNRTNNADPQNSRHIAVWVSERHNRNALYVSTITTLNGSGDSYIYQSADYNANTAKIASVGFPLGLGGTNLLNGFFGASRASGSNISVRRQNASVAQNTNSVTPVNENLVIFGTSSYYSNGRLSFYSIGEGINLALLNTRVANLMTALNTAI